jgi:hypothetical protein
MMRSARRILNIYLVLQLFINVIVITFLFAGSLAGGALYGSMMATLGLFSPYLLLTALGMNLSTAGFINLVATIGWLFTSLGRGTFRESLVDTMSVVSRLLRGTQTDTLSR